MDFLIGMALSINNYGCYAKHQAYISTFFEYVTYSKITGDVFFYQQKPGELLRKSIKPLKTGEFTCRRQLRGQGRPAPSARVRSTPGKPPGTRPERKRLAINCMLVVTRQCPVTDATEKQNVSSSMNENL